MRFGLEDGCPRTLEEVGRHFRVTRERIRQIEAKALKKLRHPSKSRKLREFLDLELTDQIEPRRHKDTKDERLRRLAGASFACGTISLRSCSSSAPHAVGAPSQTSHLRPCSSGWSSSLQIPKHSSNNLSVRSRCSLSRAALAMNRLRPRTPTYASILATNSPGSATRARPLYALIGYPLLCPFNGTAMILTWPRGPTGDGHGAGWVRSKIRAIEPAITCRN